jgi:hypothetical protein
LFATKTTGLYKIFHKEIVMNQINSKTARIVCALALSAGLFSVSNNAMAASCSFETDRWGEYCQTGKTGATTEKRKTVVANGKAYRTDSGLATAGLLAIFNSSGAVMKQKEFLGATTLKYVQSQTGKTFYARVYYMVTWTLPARLQAGISLTQ